MDNFTNAINFIEGQPLHLKRAEYTLVVGVSIDPTLSRVLLEKRRPNRPVCERHVRELSQQMTRGKFVQSGQPLKFDVPGFLIDGQHRLLAVIMSGKTIIFDLALGIPDAAHSAIDTNIEVRKLSDAISMFRGEGYAPHRRAYLAQALFILCNTSIPLNNLEQYDYWARHFSTALNWAIETFAGAKVLRNAPVAGALLCAWAMDPEVVEDFGRRLVSGEGLYRGDPAHTLRAFLLERIPRASRAESRHDTSRRVLHCVSVARQHRSLYQTRVPAGIFAETRAWYEANRPQLMDALGPWQDVRSNRLCADPLLRDIYVAPGRGS